MLVIIRERQYQPEKERDRWVPGIERMEVVRVILHWPGQWWEGHSLRQHVPSVIDGLFCPPSSGPAMIHLKTSWFRWWLVSKQTTHRWMKSTWNMFPTWIKSARTGIELFLFQRESSGCPLSRILFLYMSYVCIVSSSDPGSCCAGCNIHSFTFNITIFSFDFFSDN